MQDLKIAMVQSMLHWEKIDENLSMFTQKILPLGEEIDLIILPEMFTTGFTMNAQEVAEEMDGKGVQWMLDMAKLKDAVITGSLIIKEEDKYYNRLIWALPDGTYQYYDKRHLFSMAGEEKVFTPGKRKLVVEWKGWKICPMICYDLRFPVWARNKEGYDLLIYIACWPERRIQHWRKLLPARAIENESFVVGVNRYGDDGNGIRYNGESMLVNPMGEVMVDITYMEGITVNTLDYNEITLMRRYMPFLKDMDSFNITT